MAKRTAGKDEFLKALRAVGDALGGYDQVEVVLVGGLAGLLGGWLPEALTTKDADMIACDPEHAMAYIESEAFKVGKELGLPLHWLNSASHGYLWALPEGWQGRRHRLGSFGLLHVFFVDRLDLIALKVVASRDVDRVHLLAMKVTTRELTIVGAHLDKLGQGGADPDRIRRGRTTLEILRAQA